MASGKKRKAELEAGRKKRAERKRRAATEPMRSTRPVDSVVVNTAALAAYNSYGAPPFVARGYYVDEPFTCKECDVEQVWTARQQQWWYEVAHGPVYSRAIRCRACRRTMKAPPAVATVPPRRRTSPI